MEGLRFQKNKRAWFWVDVILYESRIIEKVIRLLSEIYLSKRRYNMMVKGMKTKGMKMLDFGLFLLEVVCLSKGSIDG